MELVLRMRSRFVTTKAVSNVIALLLLIAVTVGAAVLLYVFAIGTVSFTTTGGQQVTQQLILESYSWNVNSNQLTGSFKNVGTTPITLDSADVFINGAQVSLTAASPTVSPQQSTTFTISVGTLSSYTQGVAYTLKVVTASGAIFSYSIVFGRSS